MLNKFKQEVGDDLCVCFLTPPRVYIRENQNKVKEPFLKIASSGTFPCNV